ncbi:MAG: hypothetical protein GX247_04585, partial [Mollicutes bacterium]|nr:hypothetical protein [Mollicutes bacterium]
MINIKKNNISSLKIAFTYIGVVVGAGFATGQEILQFFLQYGFFGLIGIIISTLMFIIIGYIIMKIGRKINANSHLKIIEYANGKVLGKVIDLMITFFLFGSLTVMISGTGALFHQQFNLPYYLGGFLMSILTIITVLSGIKGIINSISFIVPFLIINLFGICLYSFINNPLNINYINPINIKNNWLLASLLYVSYNIILSISILGPLGVEAKDLKTIKKGAIIGGLGLGIGSMIIYLTLANNLFKIIHLEVPMIFIVSQISSFFKIIYTIVLLAEIYTTAVGSLYGFVSRIKNITIFSNLEKPITIITMIIALFLSKLGFSNLI